MTVDGANRVFCITENEDGAHGDVIVIILVTQ